MRVSRDRATGFKGPTAYAIALNQLHSLKHAESKEIKCSFTMVVTVVLAMVGSGGISDLRMDSRLIQA